MVPWFVAVCPVGPRHLFWDAQGGRGCAGIPTSPGPWRGPWGTPKHPRGTRDPPVAPTWLSLRRATATGRKEAGMCAWRGWG